MFRLLLQLCALVISVYLGWLAFAYPNTLYLEMGYTSIEMPLWFAIIILFTAFLLFYGALKIWHGGHDFLVSWRFKRIIKRHQQAQAKTEQCLLAWMKGEFTRALKIINKVKSKTLTHYLIAANCALHQKQNQKAHAYLTQAQTLAPSENLALGIVSLFPILEPLNKEAMDNLIEIQKQLPKHPWLLLACQQFYLSKANPEKLFPILSELSKQGRLTSDEQQKQMLAAYQMQLKHSEPEQLNYLWKQLPKYAQHDVSIILIYLEKSMSLNQTTSMLSLIRYTLKKQWHPDLLKWYAFYNQQPTAKQLAELNEWLSLHGELPEILLVLGQYCRQQKLWGKAKDYFLRCLHFPNQWQALVETMQLLDQLQETQIANDICRRYIQTFSQPSRTNH